MADPSHPHGPTSRPARARAARGRLPWTALAVACAALAVLALASGGVAGAAGKVRTVIVGSNFYSPSKLTIRRGDRVRWVWRSTGGDRHDVNVRSGPQRFHSPTQSSGTYSRRFRRPGTYKLYCTQHPMFMTVRVRR